MPLDFMQKQWQTVTFKIWLEKPVFYQLLSVPTQSVGDRVTFHLGQELVKLMSSTSRILVLVTQLPLEGGERDDLHHTGIPSIFHKWKSFWG